MNALPTFRIASPISLAVSALVLAACSAGSPTGPQSNTPAVSTSGTTPASTPAPTAPACVTYYGCSGVNLSDSTILAPPADGSFVHATGEASFKNRNGERELEIEVEDATPGTQVQFFVNSVQVGDTMASDSSGNARLNLKSKLGAVVPSAVAGQTVEVRTIAGLVVVTGIFP